MKTLKTHKKSEDRSNLAVKWLMSAEGQEILTRKMEYANEQATKLLNEGMVVNLERLLKPVTL